MNVMTMVICLAMILVGLPVVLGIGSDVYKRRLKFRERELELMGARTAEKAAQYAAHTERLEQRVRVLEEIVTDQGVHTASQIEALRAPRLKHNDVQ